MKITFAYLTAFSQNGGIEKFNCAFIKALTEIFPDKKFCFLSSHDKQKDANNQYLNGKDLHAYGGKKFRFVVAAATSPSARTPLLIPRQAPQVGFVTQNPESIKILISPSSRAWLKIAGVAGDTIALTLSETCLFSNIFAAILKSSIRPFVQEPI